MVRIVLSGGQTGVDQAAHRAARESGLLCAGWCPPDRSCEDGQIAPEFPVQPTPVEHSEHRPEVARSLRTEWNARDANGTLILRFVEAGATAPPDPGTKWTLEAVALHGREHHLMDLSTSADEGLEVGRARRWIVDKRIHVLSVAGPSERTSPGCGERAEQILSRLFAACREGHS